MTDRAPPLALPAPDHSAPDEPEPGGPPRPALSDPPAEASADDSAPASTDPVVDPLAFTPVSHRHVMHNSWTPERQRGFIDALADTGSVVSACRAVGMQTGGAYRLRRAAGAEGFCAGWRTWRWTAP